jgi:hypothetical protein
LQQEVPYVIPEPMSLSFGQTEFFWIVGVLEIVHIAPVTGRRFVFGQVFQKVHDGGLFASSGYACYINVKAVTFVAQSELQSPYSSFLSDNGLGGMWDFLR